MEENQDAFDSTTASLADKPASRFRIQTAADIDPMREYIDIANWMGIGDCIDGIDREDAAKFARAIVQAHGERTVSIETHGGLKRVIRVEQRPLVPRKPKGAKKVAEPKAKGKAIV